LSPAQAEEATPLHPYLIMGAGIAMFLAFWLLLAVVVRSLRHTHAPGRAFVLAGCAALAVGTLQGPVQAFPAVNELLDRGGDAGDVIVNLHAQLNMLGGLMVILIGLVLVSLRGVGAEWPARLARRTLALVAGGVAMYYAAGVVFAAIEAHRIAGGESFAHAVAALEPWQALAVVPAALALLCGFSAYARAALKLTVRQRAAGREALRTVPTRFTGKVPRRVRRRSPASVAGYELPLALMGFPGVGWLFAGFAFGGSILLMVGPALAWAVIPVAFTPYGSGPLRAFGWKVELAYLPLSAVVSAAALYRAQARRRAQLDGRPQRRRRRNLGSYRRRVATAVGAVALLLVTLPFVPAVAGLGTGNVRYAYQTSLPREVTGQFLQTGRGPVKLFSWGDPQSSYPSDTLRVHARDVQALLVRAAAVDDPHAYRFYDLDRGGSVPLVLSRRSPRSLELVPERRLKPGRYAFVATHEGMFGGRDFDYLTVTAAGQEVTAISSNAHGRAPQIAGALLPAAAALVALVFAIMLVSSWLRRPAAQKLLWAVGFAAFSLAATSEAIAFRHGWSVPLFRLYYVTGGVLTVAYLGAGSAWLLLPKRARDVLVGALGTATAGAVTAVLLAPVHASVLAATTATRPPANHALGGHAFVWAIVLNVLGTLFLVGGAVFSIARRRRVRQNVWIAIGALVVAAATSMSRTGDTSFIYLGELVGISLMFYGFTFTGRVQKRARAAAGVELKPAASGAD
jgi:hypothetical protein